MLALPKILRESFFYPGDGNGGKKMNTQSGKNSLTPGMKGRSTWFTTRKMTSIAILSALAFVLMLMEFLPPFVPEFLKLDFSEIPVLIGAFAFGPLSAVMIELIKNLLHLTVTQTAGVGELANFLIGSFFAGSAGLVYRYMKNRKGAILAMAVGVLIMTTAASLLNYYVLLDIYARFWTMDAIIGMGTAVNSRITDKGSLILWAFIPFNLVKATAVSVITGLIYKPLSPILHGKHSREEAKNRVS